MWTQNQGFVISRSFRVSASNNNISMLKHILQLKLSAMDSPMSLLSSNMWFCMDIFNTERAVHLYILTGEVFYPVVGWIHI